MRVCVDTNILLRSVIPIDADSEEGGQSRAASAMLADASVIIVSLPVLCEFTWVLGSVYGYRNEEIAMAIRALTGVSKVEVDRRAAGLGLDLLEAGGDFADGVIAGAGFAASADVFASFDRRAVRLLGTLGHRAEIPQ